MTKKITMKNKKIEIVEAVRETATAAFTLFENLKFIKKELSTYSKGQLRYRAIRAIKDNQHTTMCIYYKDLEDNTKILKSNLIVTLECLEDELKARETLRNELVEIYRLVKEKITEKEEIAEKEETYKSYELTSNTDGKLWTIDKGNFTSLNKAIEALKIRIEKGQLLLKPGKYSIYCKETNKEYNFEILTAIFEIIMYKYTYLNRGYSLGCQPSKGLIKAVQENYKFETIYYDRPLTTNELDEYELIDVNEV